MNEKLTSYFERGKDFISSYNTESQKNISKQLKNRDFLYDSGKQDILIFSKTKGEETKEKRHPFQEFLYALREEGLKVSTSEWLDLQKLLKEGEIQSLDDLYVVSRAVLVKDVTDYSKFDKVFGRMFYGIEFSKTETIEELWIEETEEEEPEDKEEVVEENLSQEIVEPGFTEKFHGGEDVHKAIEGSKSSGHEGGGKPQQKSKQGGEAEKQKEEGQKLEKAKGIKTDKENEYKEGKKTGEDQYEEKEQKKGMIKEFKGADSARERILARRYDQYDKDQILSYELFSRVLSKLTRIVKETTEVPTGKLNIKATVKNIAENAGIPKLVWEVEAENKPRLILMFDVGGSTDKFRPIMEKLFAAAKDCFNDVEVYYFHNAIYGEVWPQKDGNYGKNFIPLKEILKKDRDSRIIIVGDAWMAEDELYDERTDENGHYFPSGIDCFKELRKNFNHVIWINPIREEEHDEWDTSGTIAEIKKIFNMYDMTLKGLENGVKELMED